MNWMRTPVPPTAPTSLDGIGIHQQMQFSYVGKLGHFCSRAAEVGRDTLKVVGNCVVPALNVFQLPYQM